MAVSQDHWLVQSCSFFSHNFLTAWDKDSGFSTIMVDDYEDRITSFGFQEFRYEVKSDSFKWKHFWFGVDRLQGHTYGVCIDFVSLAFCTAFDIFHDIVGHFWPPVLPRH